VTKTKQIALALLATALTAFAQSDEPRYTKDGKLILPENYREWIYLSSGLGMTYGITTTAANLLTGQRFDNVFVTPAAYRSFLLTGNWPDKTVFVMEVRTSSTKGSINKGGHFQQDVTTIEAHVKDESRFPTKWEFFAYGPKDHTAKPIGPDSACQSCHSQHGAVDNTFVQFYPTLIPTAKAKGTLKER
jgi:hypothetical protein